jgi:regulator of protease activity HflC (stomatin/prohibitin superfamily)
MFGIPAGMAVLLFIWIINCVKILNEYERAVVFRLGRLVSTPKGPGFTFILFPLDRMERVSLRVITLDVPPQDIITRDNVSVKVNAVVYFRVMDPNKAITEVEDYLFATSQIAQTTLRSVMGQCNLDEILSERDKINDELQELIDKATDPWGVKVSTVEIKHVDLPQEMQRAMARQAEAERERRAKVIAALGEFEAAEKLTGAAKKMSAEPMSLQMRYLQTLVEISAEKSSTIVFPLPMEIMNVFKKLGKRLAETKQPEEEKE